MKNSVVNYASVIRSKNSGPYEITFDIIFTSPAAFNLWKKKNIITPAKIASLYGIGLKSILKIIWFSPAHAVKITIKRPIPSGHAGERDIYGAQQHAPLLDLCL
ncbi:MAG: acyl-CoA synthetase [Spirochaetes bacterium GWF1_41_5]|nr:MAG: acyl-CoA synthetase [Spirochaetes bacterium GWF1_41_5]HBE02515.1 DUF4387 domain-containing protein [Spirochaetia bacterium]